MQTKNTKKCKYTLPCLPAPTGCFKARLAGEGGGGREVARIRDDTGRGWLSHGTHTLPRGLRRWETTSSTSSATPLSTPPPFPPTAHASLLPQLAALPRGGRDAVGALVLPPAGGVREPLATAVKAARVPLFPGVAALVGPKVGAVSGEGGGEL
jgi:hypothetical protein